MFIALIILLFASLVVKEDLYIVLAGSTNIALHQSYGEWISLEIYYHTLKHVWDAFVHCKNS